MAVWSIIKKSELEGSSYIAPEFYHPDKIKSQKLVRKIGKTKIRDEFKNVNNLYNPSITKKIVKDKLKIFNLNDIKQYLFENLRMDPQLFFKLDLLVVEEIAKKFSSKKANFLLKLLKKGN